MVQACRGPTATEPTAACWPIRDTTRCTATGCCSRGVSTCTYGARMPGAKGGGSRRCPGKGAPCCTSRLNIWALQETGLLLCRFFPNGACRKTSQVSVGLWANCAALISLAAALNGASWKTSRVSELGGRGSKWDMATGHWWLFPSAVDQLGCSSGLWFSSATCTAAFAFCSPFTLGTPCRSVKVKKREEGQMDDNRQTDRHEGDNAQQFNIKSNQRWKKQDNGI